MAAILQPAESLEASHRVRAQLLRKVSASTGLTRTLRKAVSVLAAANIPSLVVGGYAVQEHGYARFTSDVDLIVPDVAAARGALSINGFRENFGSTMTVTDRVSKVEVDLLPGGGALGPGPMLLPLPRTVSPEPIFANLTTLIEMKLSSYLGSTTLRSKDYSDVVELVRANKTLRDLSLDPSVQPTYVTLWDGLAADTAGKSPIHPAP